jgi:hypothetical protein
MSPAVRFTPAVYMDNNTVYTSLYALTLNDIVNVIIHKYTNVLFFLFSSNTLRSTAGTPSPLSPTAPRGSRCNDRHYTAPVVPAPCLLIPEAPVGRLTRSF